MVEDGRVFKMIPCFNGASIKVSDKGKVRALPRKADKSEITLKY